MVNSTIFDLSAETVMTAAHRLAVQKTSGATPAVYGTFALLGGMEILAGTDADTTMVVGSLYRVDMSAWATAVRTYRLPTTAQVGERIGIYVTAGNATHEIAIRTVAASNDTINGVDYDSADWSKLFITGEIVIFECVVADTDWIVLHDGRIPCSCSMYAATAITTNLAATVKQSDMDTVLFDVGDISTEGGNPGEMTVRRAGKFFATATYRPNSSISDANFGGVYVAVAGTLLHFALMKAASATQEHVTVASGIIEVADGEAISTRFLAEQADRGHGTGTLNNTLVVHEILAP